MNRLKLLARRYWFNALVLAILAYILLTRVNLHDFSQAFVEVSLTWVLVAVLANFVSIMLKVASWKIIFDYTFENIKGRWRDLTSGVMIGFLVNAMVPARLGEIARALVISRRQALLGQPVSKSTAFGTIVLERVYDGVVLGLIVVYGIVHMDLPGWADKGALVVVFIAAFFASTLIILELKSKRLKEGSLELEKREHSHLWHKVTTRIYGIIARFSEGQKMLRSPGRVIAVFITTAASWLIQLLAVYFTLLAFHLEEVGILGALLLLILINIAGALPATPMNVGVFQLATVIPLAVTYNIPESSALAFSIGLQVIEGSIGIGVGSAFLIREGLTLGQVRDESRREMGEFAGGR